MSMGFIKDGEYVKTAGHAESGLDTITPVAVTDGAAGTVTWGSFSVKKIGKLVTINVNNLMHTTDVSSVGSIPLATGLPKPATNRVYMIGMGYGDDGGPACAFIDNLGNLGIDVGFKLATSKLYGSVTYIAAE